MSFDYSEWEALQRRRREAQEGGARKDTLRELHRLTQGEVEAGRLTEDTHWNVFLQILQGQIDAMQATLGFHEEEALASRPTEPWAREHHRTEALILRAIIDTLGRVQEIPKAMREDAGKAAEILKGLGRE